MSKRMLHPGQLKMFMTPREIESDYQPLDGDRYPVDSGEYDTHESDDDVWDRKLEEAGFLSPSGYNSDQHTDSSNVPQGHSMSHSIETQGVLSPIRLGSQFGSSGKKEIVGGHHRMAVARAVAPDRLVPVLHHSGIREAKSNSTRRVYPYT